MDEENEDSVRRGLWILQTDVKYSKTDKWKNLLFKNYCKQCCGCEKIGDQINKISKA
jgi:hypothetical protein